MTCGTLRGPTGGLVTVTNHGATELRVSLRLPGDAGEIRRYGPAGIDLLGSGNRVDNGLAVELDLAAHGFAVVGWTDPT